jgi:hypothetical protein
MSTPPLDRLRAACHRLRLYQVETELPAILEHAAKRDVSYAEFLDDVLAREGSARRRSTWPCASRWHASHSRRRSRASISSSSRRSTRS